MLKVEVLLSRRKAAAVIVSSLPVPLFVHCVCVDDRIWSLPAHGLLLSERLQPAGPAGGQRLAHLLLFTVSRLPNAQTKPRVGYFIDILRSELFPLPPTARVLFQW